MTNSASTLTEAGTSKYVQAGSIRVHYNEAGTGEPLIFCEGQGAGTSAWVVYHRVVGALSEHFRCLLLDQPGYGKSDPVTVKGESRSTMYARTVRDVMDALGIEKATIVDMSFGAQTAQVFAIENPSRTKQARAPCRRPGRADALRTPAGFVVRLHSDERGLRDAGTRDDARDDARLLVQRVVLQR